jgi:acyl carrier protein
MAMTVVNRVLHQVAPEADLDAIEPDGLLQQQIELDSMDFLQLVTALSEEAGIDIPAVDYPYLATLSSSYAYVEQALAAQSSGKMGA